MKNIVCLIILIVIHLITSGCQQEMQLEIQGSEPIHPTIHPKQIEQATLLILVRSIHADSITLGYDMATLV